MIHQPTDRPPLSAPMAELQDAYPDWSIWASAEAPGFQARCYATRLQRDLTQDQARAGLAMTLDAKTPDLLADLLTRQAEIAQTLNGRNSA